MKVLSLRLLTAFAVSGLALGVLKPQAAQAADPAMPAVSKDIGPASAGCDRFEKSSAAWTGCIGQVSAVMPSNEAFYAGYWLAKSGRYQEALRYLTKASAQDERVLTYIGFATRKLGDVDGALPFYRRALGLNPDYAVARAYLGDAYLTKGEPAKAKGELAEIGRRCGASCAEYAELAAHITAFESHAVSVVR
jgi:tetratricopeptide (TPR) repeat protein